MLPKIELQPKEQQLRRLLLDVAKSIDDLGSLREPVVLRWAGGWVRDKLLGLESHDIDVAINNMTGVTFAEHMCNYCDTPEAREAHKIEKKDIGNLHNVARNPEKSKNLETAMVKMFGLDLDFVNLRKEVYVEDSRNPIMEFGTAQEDAFRRDATINAVFYNLNTDRIEDFTGGVEDMEAKLIKTPLEPLRTFTDDPLRVLRLVRFASRLGFSIDPGVERYMGNEEVLNALRIKISRERVGIELEKMLKGNDPRRALHFIDRLGLYRAVFTDPAKDSPELKYLPRWPVVYECLEDLKKSRSPKSIFDILVRTDDAEYVAWNHAALAPWMVIPDPPGTKKKANQLPPVAGIAREGFKSPNKLTDVISASYRHREEITSLKNAVNEQAAHTNERDRLGMAIRRWDAQGGSWKLQVLNALLVEAMKMLEEWKHEKTAKDAKEADNDILKKQRDFLQQWQNFLDHLLELDLFDAPSTKRLLDGMTLAKALGIKPGKWTGKALDICMEWQLRNPEEKNPEGAIQEVRRRKEELGISI
ncbi:tRNA nucleotidyltransferase/poly(A) polymerase [Geosmithia morbida]|uniref:tRNA nucleotidyltransferase/poly(A) polymerase n=1 Tax=Geosmithia morbida TaxID=1094350 RepID=A0A9P4YZE1_9HYPO|nr:tRNA nucleotidyltransferase/poly(A) polymerase [Geosmithia morbida]KAF4125337.1 tRNA nucleotidyltransferase/poly(A) polymerase [Geosmithia morbida]